MFSKQHEHVGLILDLSPELRDEGDWMIGRLRTFEFLSDISSFAIEPTSGLLAIGELITLLDRPFIHHPTRYVYREYLLVRWRGCGM